MKYVYYLQFSPLRLACHSNSFFDLHFSIQDPLNDTFDLVYDVENISISNFDYYLGSEFVKIGKYYPHRVRKCYILKPGVICKNFLIKNKGKQSLI